MKKVLLILTGMMLAGCGASESALQPASETPEMTAETTPAAAETPYVRNTELHLDSTDLVDGVWNSEITNTANGNNASPDLHWQYVDGASEYTVVMIDPDGSSWLHWYQSGIIGAGLEPGQADSSEYIGPYPPSGTHHYNVYVYALKKHPDKEPDIAFDQGGNDIDAIAKTLDTADGTSGNIITSDIITGTYTAGE